MAESRQPGPDAATLDLRALTGSRLLDDVPCYISIQDRQFRILEMNRKLLEDFGDHHSEHCYRVYKGGREPCVECPVARTFDDGQEHTSGETIFDRRGLPHAVIVKTSPLRDPSGEIVAVMELFADITVQKELEHRLHDSLARFRNLFDVVPCFVSVHDRDFRVVEANDRFKESFRHRLGGYCYEIYKQRHEVCPTCPVADTYADGRSHAAEEIVIDSAGRQLHVMVYTAPVRDSQGRITDVIHVGADITEMRALQEELASLGRLVGGIAHSIKNVLEGLRGGVYVVNLGLRDNSQADIRTGWEMVQRNVERLSAMIMDMLYCAKPRAPRQVPVSLPEVTRAALQLYATRAKDLGVTLEADIDDSVPSVPGEPRDIHSLISNLLGNAVDACCADEDKRKKPRVLVRIGREDQQAVIQVTDNGTGMDEETRGKLFNMFFSTKGAAGTGLGLVVARKVAAEHGGAISVESTPGEGSTFTVKLPLGGSA
ncbi:MAG: PAS domain S-box protein [Acidobacteria bacterium]|nr:PAS domain S-box protein [Acidobacteriota bacterium]